MHTPDNPPNFKNIFLWKKLGPETARTTCLCTQDYKNNKKKWFWKFQWSYNKKIDYEKSWYQRQPESVSVHKIMRWKKYTNGLSNYYVVVIRPTIPYLLRLIMWQTSELWTKFRFYYFRQISRENKVRNWEKRKFRFKIEKYYKTIELCK